MMELAISETLRILIPGKNDNCAPHRFFISKRDMLMIMCSNCGGTVNVIHHVIPVESFLSLPSPCRCKESQG